MQAPDHGYWHKEDPNIRDQVGDVGEICECDNRQAGALDGAVPVGPERPADQEQGDCNPDSPCGDESCSCEHKSAEDWVHEHSPVEGKNAQFDEHQGKVVEVAENEVAFSYHHLIVLGHVDNMPTHTVWRACGGQLPLWSGVAHQEPTIAQSTCTLSNDTYLARVVRT